MLYTQQIPSNSPRQKVMSRIPPHHRPGAKSGGKPKASAPLFFADPLRPFERRVVFTNRFHEKLVGVYAEGGTSNVVLMCHGFASHKDSFIFPALAAELVKKRISSFRFDFSGNGESEGAFEFGNYLKEVAEIRCAVDWLRNQGKKLAALTGHSKGGNDVLLYASKYDDIPLVINIAGRFDCKKGVAERFGADIFEKIAKQGKLQMVQERDDGTSFDWILTKQSLEERMNTDMLAATKSITVSEVLTIHGSADATVPAEDAQEFSKNIRCHTLYIVDGADHNFRNPHQREQIIKKIVDVVSEDV